MPTLTDDQLADFQSDIGITDDETVFTDVELNRHFTRAEGDYNRAVVYALRQFLANAVKFADYVQNASQEKQSQIRDGYVMLLNRWEKIAGMEGGPLRTGVIALGLDASEDNQSEWDGSAEL